MSAASLKRGIGWLLGSTVALGVLFLYAVALWVVLPICRLRRRSSKVSAAGLRILITGRVNSWNWSRSHLLPLAEAECVDQVLAVMDGPVIAHPKIVAHSATEPLVRGLGRLVARSLVLVRVAVRERPQVIVGYSFFSAALLGLITAAAGRGPFDRLQLPA